MGKFLSLVSVIGECQISTSTGSALVTAQICHAYPYRDCGDHHCSEILCNAEVAAIVSDELREPCEVSALTRLLPGSHSES